MASSGLSDSFLDGVFKGILDVIQPCSEMRERSIFGSRVLREGIIFTNKDLNAVLENKMSTKENLWDLHLPLSLIFSLSTVFSFIITVYFLAITCL